MYLPRWVDVHQSRESIVLRYTVPDIPFKTQ